MPKLKEANIKKLVDKHCTKGRIGWVKFRKADDTIRTMTFIKVPASKVKGTGQSRSHDPNLVTVYDISKKAVRSFKPARVLSLSVGGKKYTR